jgi:tetratricopeptide (TPR) repeat protein
MKIYFFQLLVLITILTSCKNSNKIPSSLAEFDQTEKSIIDKLAVQQAQAVNDTVIKKETKNLITGLEAYIEKNPKDTANVVKHLYKVGELAKAVGLFGNSIKLWGQIQREYPLHPKAGDALFMQAFTFENDLQDKDSAKKYYMDFLKRFPDHSFANDAKQLLSMIDKSPEELIKEFEAKNAKNVN